MPTGDVADGGAGKPTRRGRGSAIAGLVAVLVAVPIAIAAPGDLDQSFGNGGVVELPSGDRYQAVDAPLVQSNGRIVFAGLLKNSSDRVFLSAVTPTGAIDTSFGTAGEVHTNSVAPQRKAATALAPDGRLYVAGGSNADGKLVIERFTANGARDNGWGTSGRVTIDLGGPYARPTGAVAQADGTVLVTVQSQQLGRDVFTIVKSGNKGGVTGFGTKGIVRVPVGAAATHSTAQDLAITGTKILLAGSSGPDTALVRLNASNGSLDSGFGTGGKAVHSVDSGADYAGAMALAQDGKILIAGPAAAAGFVARLNTTGGLDTTYGGGDGVVAGGLMAAGMGYAPVDVLVDSAGRAVVGGTALEGPTSRWAFARLKPDGSALDGSFGSSGRVVLSPCQNTVGAGPTGMTASGDNILVLGACEDSARTSVARILGGGGPAVGPITSFEVAPKTEAAGHERILLSRLDPSAAASAAEEIQSTYARRTYARRTYARRTDIATAYARRTYARRTGLLSTYARRTILDQALLSEVSLVGIDWHQLLGLSPDVPLQSLTLADAYDIKPDAVGSLTLAELDLNSAFLQKISLTSLMIGVRPLSALPPPPGGDWCAYLASQPHNCGTGVSPASTFLVELEAGGDDLSDYYDEPLSLRRLDLGSGESGAPLGDLLLRELDLSISPFKTAKASEFQAILACNPCQGTLADLTDADLGDATVAQLVARLPQPSLQDLSVGDVMLAMLDRAEIPYELLPRQTLLDHAEYRSQNLVTYTARFTIDCSQASVAELVLTAPDDARPVDGGATASLNSGPVRQLANGKPAQGKSGPFTFQLAPACQGVTAGTHQIEVVIKVEPGSILGPVDGAKVTVRGGDGDPHSSNAITTRVDDSRDPLEPRQLDDESLQTGHISSATDVDEFEFHPGAGRTTVSLSHLPADYDLIIRGPTVDPEPSYARRTYARRTYARRTPLSDSTEEPTDESNLPPDQIHDIYARRTDGMDIRASSIHRDTADEAASFEVTPDEAGERFVAEVIGYNGANAAESYVIRRSEAPNGNRPACPARSYDSSFSYEYPSDIPVTTTALYLVDPVRMADRDGVAATQTLMNRLEQIAAITEGVVIPVQGNPRRPTAGLFDAWDADPCSVEKANAVVSGINDVIDDAREQGSGLPNLRSIVIAAPDDVIPQARLVDRTGIGTESDYADDATSDRNGDGARDDNSVSAAFRAGYYLSDDAYGDFDPYDTGFVPDVALGRLVENAGQMTQQLQAYIDSAEGNGDRGYGFINPQRAFVTGYDFLSDGSQETFDILSGAVPSGAAQSQINDSWTGQQAIDGANASDPGYIAINAHYDHFGALPAAAFSGIGSPNLFDAVDVNVPRGSAAFTVGCHGGLSMAIGDASTQSDPRLHDWVEQMAANGAQYVGNTGYGYGDDTAVAYSERLMADYARGLVSADVTAGQALMLAKQSVAQTVGVGDPYWDKASMEATYYGLPFYRITAEGSEGAAAVPGLPIEGPNPNDARTRSSTPLSIDLRDNLHRNDEGDGTSWWQVDDEAPLVVDGRPIQPKLTNDVTSEEGPAHGFVLDSLTTAQDEPSRPSLGSASIDLAAHEPPADVSEPHFPATYATVEPQATSEGRRDILTLMAGAWRGDRQRLNLEVGGRVLRSTSTDFSPPTIRRVDGLVTGDRWSVRVDADGDDLLGGVLLYATDAEIEGGGEVEWHTANLSVIAPGILAAGGTLPSGSEIREAIAQVIDTSNNVAFGDFKAIGYPVEPLPASEPGDPRVVVNPAPGSGGYHAVNPEISLNKGEHGDATFEVSVDGGAFVPDPGPFRVSDVNGAAEGEHIVTYRGSDDSIATARFAVDRNGPTISAETNRAADVDGWYNAPVTWNFTCADAVSGVASCPEPVTIATDGAAQSTTVSSSDHAGNSTSFTTPPVKYDQTDPTVAITTRSGIILGGNQRLQGTAGDVTSGVKSVRVTYSGLFGERSADAVLTCKPDGSCTWTADLPGIGAWSATAEATDRAGNTSPATGPTLITVR